MMHSKITDGPHPEQDVAHAYKVNDDSFKEDDYGENLNKALSTNTFLKKETIDKSQNVWMPENWESTTNPELGYSWFVADKEGAKNNLGVKVISHTGWQGGFRAFYISIPAKNTDDVRIKGVELLKKHNWLAE